MAYLEYKSLVSCVLCRKSIPRRDLYSHVVECLRKGRNEEE